MEKVTDEEKLSYYISTYGINEIFSIDMKPYMELFFFNKNDHICRAEEKIDYLFFFVEGKAKVYSTLSNGKSLLLCFYKPFKVIGELEFINFETADSNIQVIEETYCIGIAMEKIRELVLNDSMFLRFMCSSLGEKLMRLSNYSSINLLYPLQNRLASYILAVTDCDENSIIFDGNLSEVSELLGTSYRHLLRTLNLLCNQEVIKKNDHYYEIIDKNVLEKLAGDLYE